jgi:hypothetical protein
MHSRSRRVFAIVGIVLVAVVAGSFALPGVARHLAIARIRAITHRPVSIGALDLRLSTGHITIHDLRITERDGRTPFAGFARLDLRVRWLPLARGHVWIRDLVLQRPTVNVVRSPEGFNLADMIGSAEGGQGEPLDVTVERFALIDGTLALEDRALPEPRTWTSRSIVIAGRNFSTRRDDGEALGTSVTAGAATSVDVRRMRLYPIHLEATATTRGLDLALARLYVPPASPVTVERGLASSTLRVTYDHRAGVRAEATNELTDVVLARPGEADPLAIVPKLTAELTRFSFEQGRIEVGRFEVTGSATVRDPTAGPRARTQLSKVRASIADVTWPITTPGRLDVETAIPGGGTATLAGTLRPPPDASQLRLRLAAVDLAPWTRLLPVAARISGLGEVDLSVDEPLAVGVPARVRGSAAVSRLAIGDGKRELAGAQRITAAGIEARWPERIGIDRLTIAEPRAVVERDRTGAFPVRALFAGPVAPAGPPSTARAASSRPAPRVEVPAPRVEVKEIAVRGGALTWHDAAVTPAARLEVAQLEGTVTGGAWPLRQPLSVRAALRPPGGGELRVAGRVGVAPVAADVRVTAVSADLAPYRPYVPTVARITGRADAELAVVVPPGGDGPITARGTAGVSRLDVRDQERSVMKAERAAASGVDLAWPGRLTARQLLLTRPWVLIERDEQAALTLRPLLAPPPAARASAPAPTPVAPDGRPAAGFPITFGEIVVDDGGARVVDRGVTPAFALDLYHLAGRVERFTTGAAGQPGRVELTGRVGNEGHVTLRGTVGPLGGPFRLDVESDIRSVAMTRANPYLVHHIAWEARDGWLSSHLRCRIDGQTLDARTELVLSGLQVARVATEDGARARLGLPLGTMVSLMKDRRGEIRLALPVGGRLNDPRFEFSEAIWGAVRTVAVNAITAPVSWIGRVRATPDARIQRIEIDPIPFAAGAATPTPEGREQVTRLVAFLQQMRETRMTLTPVVAPAEVAPNGKAPAELGAQRIDAVRDLVKKAGVDPDRLVKAGTVDTREGGEPQVKLELAEPESPSKLEKRPNPILRRLPGFRE